MPESLVLSKFDVAERQLNQAIRLFFEGGDPVSVHTLSEAAAQVLYDIRRILGTESKLRDAKLIREEYRKEWLAALAKSRNFFKHADRDPTDVHEFKEEFNHFSLLDGVAMYAAAKHYWTPETIVFFMWFGAMYPDLLKPDPKLDPIMNKARLDHQRDPTGHKAMCARAIQEMRAGRVAVPNVSLELGARVSDRADR